MKTQSKSQTGAPDRLPNPHPGRILRKHFLEPLQMTQVQLHEATGIPTSRITELIKERRGITADTAIRLARVLGPHPQFWIGLQATYDLEEAMLSKGKEYDALKRYPMPAAVAA
ncbi:MAG: addiction module antidote protein, HigA family [Verrucomicrobia bacterium 12-59-8]|nr:MAG: addiction module antidote protein, HigA family [Verrucomicrobia bacterium 12-59-8]